MSWSAAMVASADNRSPTARIIVSGGSGISRSSVALTFVLPFLALPLERLHAGGPASRQGLHADVYDESNLGIGTAALGLAAAVDGTTVPQHQRPGLATHIHARTAPRHEEIHLRASGALLLDAEGDRERGPERASREPREQRGVL